MKVVKRSSRALVASAMVVAGWASTAGPARAVDLVCGSVITSNTTLTHDIGPCSGKVGLVVAADNVTLDLGGHRVFGTEVLTAPDGQSVGVRVDGTRGSRVTNGEVSNFNVGVEIKNGSGNTLDELDVHDNFGPWTSRFGDGILVNGSKKNTVTNNTVAHNGPFGGITLLGASTDNLVDGNAVLDNNVAEYENGVPVWQQVMGIRLEGPGASNNTISDNEVARTGRQGIAVLSTCKSEKSKDGCSAAENTGNTISGNNVHHSGVGVYFHTTTAHGYHSHTVGGEGILFMGMGPMTAGYPQDNKALNNISEYNLGHGVAFWGGPQSGNELIGNSANNNGGSAPHASGTRFIAADGIFAGRNTSMNTISGNTANGNSRSGVYVQGPATSRSGVVIPGSTNNTLTGNNGTGNAAFDGFDENLNCDNNAWSGNIFNTTNQACVAAP